MDVCFVMSRIKWKEIQGNGVMLNHTKQHVDDFFISYSAKLLGSRTPM